MKKNYSMTFFGRKNGDFSVSPSEYHRAWRNRVGAGRAFVGPWNYAGASPGSISRRQYQSPQEQPKVAHTPVRGSVSPQEVLKATNRKGGFISPVNDLKITKRKIYKTGANRTQALSEE